jgi:hypothetical protein
LKARPVHLLSGLLKCGCCGSGHVGHCGDRDPTRGRGRRS